MGEIYVQVLSPPASFLGWQATLRPLQKKHARSGSFLGSFPPLLPRCGLEGKAPPSLSSSSSSSESTPPFPPTQPPPVCPSRCPRGSVSGYMMNVRVCRLWLRGVGADDRDRDRVGTGTMSSGYGRWPIGDWLRGGRSGGWVSRFVGRMGADAATSTSATC